MARKLLGYQLANARGENIQGDLGDPLNLASFEIIPPDVETLQYVAEVAAPEFLLMPIYEGDIEAPAMATIITATDWRADEATRESVKRTPDSQLLR